MVRITAKGRYFSMKMIVTSMISCYLFLWLILLQSRLIINSTEAFSVSLKPSKLLSSSVVIGGNCGLKTTTCRTMTAQYEDQQDDERPQQQTTSSSSTSSTSVQSWYKELSRNDRSLLYNSYHPSKLLNQTYDGQQYVADYIIIGSGIGGLWLGACLAKFNISSVVLEQHYIAGGFQHTFKKGGYEFVPGLHYIANLQLCSPLYDMVATKPLSLPSPTSTMEGGCATHDTTTTYTPPAIHSKTITYHQAGNSVPADKGELTSHELKIGDLPVLHVREGLDNARQELTRVFPDETVAIDEFLKMMEAAKWQAGQFATFKIFPKWLQFLTSQFLCSSYIKFASQTTEQVLDKLTKDGRLKTVLSAFGGDLGESIGDGSFVMQAAVLGHVLEGCYYPQGGPIQFVRGLIPTIKSLPGGNVFVNARVAEILVDDHDDENENLEHGTRYSNKNNDKTSTSRQPLVHRVRLANGDILSSRLGVVSDCGFRSTLKLLPDRILQKSKDGVRKGGRSASGSLQRLADSVEQSSGGISHVFCFVGLNATNEELNLKSSSYYYIPWNDTNKDTMDATEIQDYYRDTLLDPNVLDVSAGIVFASAKDPLYAAATMPGKSTVIVFSEAKSEDFHQFIPDAKSETSAKGGGGPRGGGSRMQSPRTECYQRAKKLIETKMMRSLLLNFPHLEPYIDVVEVGTPLTLFDYTRRFETLGLRHTPQRMCDMELRPDCKELPGLYFTGTYLLCQLCSFASTIKPNLANFRVFLHRT